MVDQQEALSRFLPPGSSDLVVSLISEWKFHLRITRKRATKVGDYRPPQRGHTHRISLNHDLNPYAFLLTFIHEVAHLINYEQHKRIVNPHGKEWKAVYKDLLLPFLERKVFPEDVEKAVKDFFRQRGESNRSDLELNSVLRKYDPPNGTLTISELPHRALFKLADGRLFIKGEQLRKRFRCYCFSNRKTYLVSHLMEVYPIHYQYQMMFPEVIQ
ncbi:MAG: SprT-like domain-containing protein [Bacteroidetes bacterium]|nr:SprT-like domain-containing protein [Bacteroidota bacterium]